MQGCFERIASCPLSASPSHAFQQEDKGITGELDLVHPKQKRRYYSSLIDGSCEDLPTGLKKAQGGGIKVWGDRLKATHLTFGPCLARWLRRRKLWG